MYYKSNDGILLEKLPANLGCKEKTTSCVYTQESDHH